MKFYPLLILSFMSLAGCASIESLRKAYGQIEYADGVSEKEAKLVAQNHLLDSPYRGPYDIFRPWTAFGPSAEKYPNFWFIVFPVQEGEASAFDFVVVVDKRTGGVIRAREWSSVMDYGLEGILK